MRLCKEKIEKAAMSSGGGRPSLEHVHLEWAKEKKE